MTSPTGNVADFTAAFARTGAREWLRCAEVPVLRELLRPGERVEYLTLGKLPVSARPALRNWLLALTDTRLLCIKGSDARTRTVVDVPYHAMVSVSHARRLLAYEVLIATPHGRIRIAARAPEGALLGELLNTKQAEHAPRERADPFLLSDTLRSQRAAPSDRDRRIDALEETVDQLEQELAAMRQQVDFMEELLRGRTTVPADQLRRTI